MVDVVGLGHLQRELVVPHRAVVTEVAAALRGAGNRKRRGLAPDEEGLRTVGKGEMNALKLARLNEVGDEASDGRALGQTPELPLALEERTDVGLAKNATRQRIEGLEDVVAGD